MKNGFIVQILLVFAFTLGTGLFAQYSGGDGTPGDPYQIETRSQLDDIEMTNIMEPDAYYIQIADIDLSAKSSDGEKYYDWYPIGDYSWPFTGNYNGNGYKILNLYINNTYDIDMGLFGVNEGTLQNIVLSGVSVTGTAEVGALAGANQNGGSIINCSSSGNIYANGPAGGLVGCCYQGSIFKSYSVCNVEGSNQIGGLVGNSDSNSTISDSFARGMIYGYDVAGGLVGQAYLTTITNCFSTGPVSIDQWGSEPGGLIGYAYETTVTSSYWDKETSGCSTSFGGTGKTTAQMKSESTFSGWDFSTPVWELDSLNNGYPHLTGTTPELPVFPFEGGRGTIEDPYLVAFPHQLNNVRDHLDGYFVQIANIDLGSAPWNEAEGWDPIGDDVIPFTGGYDGGNYSIFNMTISRSSENCVGLFGSIDECCIKNIRLINSTVQGLDNTGALAGYAFMCDSTIVNCSSSGSVSGRFSTGGLFGFITECNIAGSSSACNISNSGAYAGGLVGNVTNRTSIMNSFSTGNVTGGGYVGGFAGYIQDDNTIVNCHSTGNVTGADYTGGFIGISEYFNSLTNCYASSTVSGRDITGGFAGRYNNGPIKNCFASGSVQGRNSVGGFFGYFNNQTYSEPKFPLTNCYSSGYIDGTGSNVNGFIGYYEDGIATHCYWDIEASGKIFSMLAEGKTTAEMQKSSTFHNWDFTTPIWKLYASINNGYPYLEEYETLPVGPFAGGTGTSNDPYLIATPDQLDSVRNHLSSHYLQTNDIYLDIYPWNNGDGWVPLSIGANYFSGSFNGNDNIIKGLTINNAGEPGLFGTSIGASFSNVRIDSVYFTGGNISGALASACFSCTLYRCSSSGEITSSNQTGGLVGDIYDSSADECNSSCNVTSNFSGMAGGLFGVIHGNSNVSDCYASGAVFGQTYSGGFAGALESSSLSNCYSAGSVTGVENIGGFISYSTGSTVSSCYWDTVTSGQSSSACGEGKNTAEMQTQTTYVNWDFVSKWNILSGVNGGYPYLKWEGRPTPFGVPQNVRTEISGTNIIISWDEVIDAVWYEIIASANPYGTYSYYNTVEETSCTIPITEAKKFFQIKAWNYTK